MDGDPFCLAGADDQLALEVVAVLLQSPDFMAPRMPTANGQFHNSTKISNMSLVYTLTNRGWGPRTEAIHKYGKGSEVKALALD